MKNFKGNVLFLDRSDINTDEIIPARYLTEITKEALKPFLLEDLSIPGFDPRTDLNDKVVIVTRENFGSGSSREHAPWALEVNGITVVVAENFARIFRQNMFNNGLLAIELPKEQIDHLFNQYAGGQTTMEVDLENDLLKVNSKEKADVIPFTIGGFDKTLVAEGGWINYADKRY